MATLTNEFKSEFALLLMIMKVTYSVTTTINYSRTLFEWSLAGLVTDKKIFIRVRGDGKSSMVDFVDTQERIDENKNDPEHAPPLLAPIYARCARLLREAEEMIKTDSVGRKAYVQSEILQKCGEVNMILFPIALSEGLLELKDATKKIMSGMPGLSNVGIERDE